MTTGPLAVHRTSAELAIEMIALFGADARSEASLRARRSRNAGNVSHYCHWRQAVRLIDSLVPVQGNSLLH